MATTQEASLIQYGKYKYAKTLSDMSGKPVDQIQSGVIYLAETRESQEDFSYWKKGSRTELKWRQNPLY